MFSTQFDMRSCCEREGILVRTSTRERLKEMRNYFGILAVINAAILGFLIFYFLIKTNGSKSVLFAYLMLAFLVLEASFVLGYFVLSARYKRSRGGF